MPLPEHVIDRKTSLHDSIKSYIRLRRLCVVQEERGKRYADFLITAAFEWARENAEEIGKGAGGDVPVWRGLVCVHAQEKQSVFGRGMDFCMMKEWDIGLRVGLDMLGCLDE
jgi:GNAT superfamily N-acetyltransferase